MKTLTPNALAVLALYAWNRQSRALGDDATSKALWLAQDRIYRDDYLSYLEASDISAVLWSVERFAYGATH